MTTTSCTRVDMPPGANWQCPPADQTPPRAERQGSSPPPLADRQGPPPSPPVTSSNDATAAPASPLPPHAAAGPAGLAPHGFGQDWHTLRFSNTTAEPVTVAVTLAAGQPLPSGVDASGKVTIAPGQSVDLTFAPGSSANFRSTKGDGSVWNQGEVFFDEGRQAIWGNMSYIYGANSNMRLVSEQGQHSGHLGDLVGGAPQGVRVGDWGVQAPYDRDHHSDDPRNPGSATAGPDGPKTAGAAYLYSVLDKGEGYVHRGRPAQVNDFDDASSLRFGGRLAVVF